MGLAGVRAAILVCMTSLTSIASTSQGDAASPLVLLLHGYGSHEHDLPGLMSSLPPLPWASVRAPLDMGNGGAAWFPLPPTWGGEAPQLDQHAIDAATTRLWTWIDQEVAPDRPLVPIGFSQGGLMALQLLRTRPERVAATAVLAGFASGAPQPGDARLAASRPPVFWGRGDADAVIWPASVALTERLLPQWSRLDARVYAGLGHAVSPAMLHDLDAFLRGALQEAEAP